MRYLILCLLVSGCAGASTINRDRRLVDPAIELCNRTMTVWVDGTLPPKVFFVVSKVDSVAPTAVKRWSELRYQACELGGDAVVSVRTVYDWGGDGKPRAKEIGFIVKFKSAGSIPKQLPQFASERL